MLRPPAPAGYPTDGRSIRPPVPESTAPLAALPTANAAESSLLFLAAVTDAIRFLAMAQLAQADAKAAKEIRDRIDKDGTEWLCDPRRRASFLKDVLATTYDDDYGSGKDRPSRKHVLDSFSHRPSPAAQQRHPPAGPGDIRSLRLRHSRV